MLVDRSMASYMRVLLWSERRATSASRGAYARNSSTSRRYWSSASASLHQCSWPWRSGVQIVVRPGLRHAINITTVKSSDAAGHETVLLKTTLGAFMPSAYPAIRDTGSAHRKHARVCSNSAQRQVTAHHTQPWDANRRIDSGATLRSCANGAVSHFSARRKQIEVTVMYGRTGSIKG